MANLYGGRDKLKIKLDKFFATRPGSDGGSDGMIHEVREALRGVYNKAPLLGEYQAFQPDRAPLHLYVQLRRSAFRHAKPLCAKSWTSSISPASTKAACPTARAISVIRTMAQQSAWYVLSAMGFYPVSMGRPEYAIGAPYFPKMTIGLRDADRGDEQAQHRTARWRMPPTADVQAVRLNGKAVTRNYLLHTEMAKGGDLSNSIWAPTLRNGEPAKTMFRHR